MRLLPALLMIALFGCTNTEQLTLFVSNEGIDKFEKVNFEVQINGKEVFNDSVQNEYLSFSWVEKQLQVNEDELQMLIRVNGDNFSLKKDTTVVLSDSAKLFVKFEFSPYYKRYTNPEIYQFFTETSDLKVLADSLYNNGIIDGGDYLNDTIPLSENLSLFTK